MLQIGYNIPEGYGYTDDDFAIDSLKSYEQRYEEIQNAFINNEVVCAKVVKVFDNSMTLYLDFGAGVKGICDKNFVSNKNNYWLNNYLIRQYVNVRILSYNIKRNMFICIRDILQMNAFQIQKERYKYNDEVKAKIVGYNSNVAILDIGAGNLLFERFDKFINYVFSPEKKYIDVNIGKFNAKHNNFVVSHGKKIHLVKIVTRVEEGYLVSFINEPGKYMVMSARRELNVGDTVIANIIYDRYRRKSVLAYVENLS